MARPYRLQGENCFYHITSRGDDRKKIYISEFDFKKFLEYILRAKERFKFYLYAYVLMPNHYHLLVETLQANLSKIMHYLNTSYTTYYNVKRKKYGHLFQGRYKSILVDKDSYFQELSRYIHLNPVRAGIVKSPEEYKWSSYRGYLNKRGDGYIDKNHIDSTLDMTATEYRQFVLDGMEKEENPFKDIYAGFMLGPGSFIKERLQDLKDRLKGSDIAHKKALTRHVGKDEIINAVAKKYHEDPEELYKSKRRSVKAKKVAIYLMKRLSNLTNSKIGESFGITYSAVSKTTSNIERLMDENRNVRKEVEELISHFKV